MAQLERRAVLGGLALLLSAAAGAAATPSRRLAEELAPLDFEADIPQHFGNWSADRLVMPVLPAPDVEEKLESLYNKLLTRTYIDADGRRIMFVIAYGADQADRMSLAHLPEACYSSQGFQVWPSVPVAVPVNNRPFPLVHLRTRKGPRVEPVTYWTTVGDEVLVDEFTRRWVRAKYSLRGIIPDGMLVRVSSIDANEDQAFELQAAFVSALYDSLAPPTRARLFGSAA
jgi:EpsI family protein